MKVDMHVHSKYSKDALTKPETIIKTAEKTGVDALALTDHDTIAGWEKTKKAAEDSSIELITGQEVKLKDGSELLCVFLNKEIKSKEFHGVIDEVRDQDGLVIVPHPYGRLRKTFKHKKEVSEVDGIEIFNPRCYFNFMNKQALTLAMEFDKPGTAGSDAHTPLEIGRAYVKTKATDLEEFREKLLQGETRVKGRRTSPLFSVFNQIAKITPIEW